MTDREILLGLIAALELLWLVAVSWNGWRSQREANARLAQAQYWYDRCHTDEIRERRERRAVSGRAHTLRHFAEGAVPSEWAAELLAFTIGTRETTENE